MTAAAPIAERYESLFAELAARYRRAVALLVPGQDEGLGLAAVEAQLSATPVVAAASGVELTVRAGEQAPYHPGRCAELIAGGRVTGAVIPGALSPHEEHPEAVAAAIRAA